MEEDRRVQSLRQIESCLFGWDYINLLGAIRELDRLIHLPVTEDQKEAIASLRGLCEGVFELRGYDQLRKELPERGRIRSGFDVLRNRYLDETGELHPFLR